MAFTPATVTVTDEDGGKIVLTTQSFPDRTVTGFSGMAEDADHRHVGWQVEEVAIPGAAPIASSLLVLGPHTRLDISTGEQIHAWHFLPGRRVSVCSGPAHGPQPDRCMVYALPD